jgi:anti-sigma factor RsiW
MTAECRHEICLSLFEKMSDYIDRELDETTCQDIEKHASECFACKVCLETLKRTVDLCHEMEPSPVPPSLTERLRDAFEKVEKYKDSTFHPRR